jgi:hypothetical protein
MVESALTKHRRSATDFFVSQHAAARFLAMHGGLEFDIDGALEADQPGMAFIAAQTALHLGIFIYLLSRGEAGAAPANATDVVNLRDQFERLADSDSHGPLWQEAWRLGCMNPRDRAEVASYARQCLRFVREDLRLEACPGYGAIFSPESSSRFGDLMAEFATVLDGLGVTGGSAQVSRWKDQREIVERKLKDSADDRTPR